MRITPLRIDGASARSGLANSVPDRQPLIVPIVRSEHPWSSVGGPA